MAYKIYLYDTETDCIGGGSLSSAYIQYQLEAAAGQDVEVHISSVGGSAFDAIAIYDLLKKYNGNLTTHIDALAASAASIVAMGGQRIFMSKYALLMIHKPMVGSGGNADELLKDVAMLDSVQDRLAQIYMDKTGLDNETINGLINAVTWMSAEQALDFGFIDEIETYEEGVTDKVKNSVQIRKFAKTAPAVYQRCINKILLPETQITNNNDMNPENKELIEKTTSVLDKIMNFFKKVVAKKTVTNKGELHYVGALAVGTEVFNSEDLENKVEDDDDMEATDEAGNKVTISVKNGVVTAMEEDDEDEDPDADPDADPDEDEDDDIDPDNRATLTALNIAVENKVTANAAVTAIMPKLKEFQNKQSEFQATIDSQIALLVEARTSLQEANDKLEKTRKEIKNEIKSQFNIKGSKRADKIGIKEDDQDIPDGIMPPEGSIGALAVKDVVARAKAAGRL